MLDSNVQIRIRLAIVVMLAVMGFASLGLNWYLYKLYSRQAADHFNPSAGYVYQVVMNGKTVFLTPAQEYTHLATLFGALGSLGLAAYLRHRWKSQGPS